MQTKNIAPSFRSFLLIPLLTVYSIVLLGSPSFSALTALETRLNNSFPSNISDWERSNTIDFEKDEAGLGIGINYTVPDAVATIYVYTNNYSKIPNGIGSKIIKKEFADCLSSIYTLKRQGIYLAVNKLGEGKKKYGIDKKMEVLYAKLNIMRSNNVRTGSYLYLASFKNHFFKVRLTYTENSLSEDEIKLFMDSVVDLALQL